jgi:hypothetical protein
MTVAELRQKLADFPDDLPVVITCEFGYEPATTVESIILEVRRGVVIDTDGTPHLLIAGF